MISRDINKHASVTVISGLIHKYVIIVDVLYFYLFEVEVCVCICLNLAEPFAFTSMHKISEEVISIQVEKRGRYAFSSVYLNRSASPVTNSSQLQRKMHSIYNNTM